MDKIEQAFKRSIEVKNDVITSGAYRAVETMADVLTESIKKGGKLLICGNGGSAADAQHLAAEFLVRLRPMNNRQGIPALALAQDTSTITACGNDFGYDVLFQRMVETLGAPGDVLLGISTSGNSHNVILAMQAAKEAGIETFGFLGAGGGKMLEHCEHSFVVPSSETARIQESHITAGHALMELVEDNLIEQGFLTLR